MEIHFTNFMSVYAYFHITVKLDSLNDNYAPTRNRKVSIESSEQS